MIERIPAYVVSGFLDSGKTTLIKTLIEKQSRSPLPKKIFTVFFEQGDEEMEEDFLAKYDIETMEVSVGELQSEGGMKQVLQNLCKCIDSYMPDEIWIEWNGMLPIATLMSIIHDMDQYRLNEQEQKVEIKRNIFVADGSTILNFISQTGGVVFDQLFNSDVVIVRKAGSKEKYKDLKKVFKNIIPGVKVHQRKNIHEIQKEVYGQRIRPEKLLFYFTIFLVLAYIYMRWLVGSNTFDLMTGVFVGILLQALPFLIIGILISSAIQVFVPAGFIESHFPKNPIKGQLYAICVGFFLPVCDCAAVPMFQSLVKKGVPVHVAVTFMMASPIVNPIVIFSTWYAFGGDFHIVLCRVILGIICAFVIGITFMNEDVTFVNENRQYMQGFCSCGCCGIVSTQETGVLGKIVTLLKHAQNEFFNVGKYLVLGAFISSVFQVIAKNITWTDNSQKLLISMMILMIMAFFLSLCSSSDAIVAKSFMSRFPMGALIAFLVFGPMLDVKNLTMLTGQCKRKFILKLCATTTLVCLIVVYVSFRMGLGALL